MFPWCVGQSLCFDAAATGSERVGVLSVAPPAELEAASAVASAALSTVTPAAFSTPQAPWA